MFKGIAPEIRYSDPDYFRFELRLFMHHITNQFNALNEQMRKSMANFNEAMKAFGESLKRLNKHLPKERNG